MMGRRERKRERKKESNDGYNQCCIEYCVVEIVSCVKSSHHGIFTGTWALAWVTLEKPCVEQRLVSYFLSISSLDSFFSSSLYLLPFKIMTRVVSFYFSTSFAPQISSIVIDTDLLQLTAYQHWLPVLPSGSLIEHELFGGQVQHWPLVASTHVNFVLGCRLLGPCRCEIYEFLNSCRNFL